MLIDDVHAKVVTFLYADDRKRGERTSVGSAFFVELPVVGSDAIAEYVVTANHVVTMCQAANHWPLYARVNTIDGGYENLLVPDWESDFDNEIAATSLRKPIDELGDRAQLLDVLCIAPHEFVRDEIQFDRMNPGVGDDVFFIGLFERHPGKTQNQPAFRFGNISLMPKEKVRVEIDRRGGTALVHAYLVEARSHSGHSGSPAFLYMDIPAWTTIEHRTYPPALLGLVQGHFDSTSDLDLLGDIRKVRKENAGMAVIIPASAILRLLIEREAFVNEREEIRHLRESEELAATADVLLSDDDETFGPGDFNEALRRATRITPPKSDPEGGGTSGGNWIGGCNARRTR